MSSAAQNTATVLPDCDGSHPRGKFDLLLLLLVTAVVRGMVLWILPKHCLSIDIDHWQYVAVFLYNGKNPYAITDFHLLNWPPFWMEVIYLLMRLAVDRHGDFFTYVRVVLIVADLGVLAALYKLAGLLQPRKRHLKLFFWGYCLNPVLMSITIVHANFDAFATFWILLFLFYLIRFRQKSDVIDWLTAAGCLGMGIFTKTFPLLLWPLLVPGALKVSGRARVLGLLFLFGPVVFSLGAGYMLSPQAVHEGVIGYHSLGSEFGVLSLLSLAGIPSDSTEWYGSVFSLILLVGSIILAIVLYKRDVGEDANVVLLSTLLLMAVFTLGPGYGAQYWFWVLPLLLLCFAIYGGRFHGMLLVCGAIIIATNTFEYAIEQWLGGFLSEGLRSKRLLAISDHLLETPRLLALVRLPMSLAAIWILIFGTVFLVKRSPREVLG